MTQTLAPAANWRIYASSCPLASLARVKFGWDVEIGETIEDQLSSVSAPYCRTASSCLAGKLYQ